MNRTELIGTAQAVIKERDCNGLNTDDHYNNNDFLCVDFLEGFHEGVAEFLAVLLKEPACDLLEEIENYPMNKNEARLVIAKSENNEYV